MRYFRRGLSKATFLSSAPTPAAPTQAQITAGTVLSTDLFAMDGWQYENQPIATPDLANTFTSNIPGEDTVGAPTMDIYEDDTTATLWTALAKGTVGYMVLMPTGQAATKPSEVWSVRVAGRNRVWDAAGNVAAAMRVSFAVFAVPVYGTQAA